MRRKTTISIADALLRHAKRVARRARTAVRAMVERPRLLLDRDIDPEEAFRLRRASYAGEGLQADFGAGEWHRLRDAIYERRGGCS